MPSAFPRKEVPSCSPFSQRDMQTLVKRSHELSESLIVQQTLRHRSLRAANGAQPARRGAEGPPQTPSAR